MEVKKKKNLSLLIASVIVALIVGGFYLGIRIYGNYLVKLYENETNKLIPIAKEYVSTNQSEVEKNIFNKLDVYKKATDGIVYVNENKEVALAIIYDDVCYVKHYDSDALISSIGADYCKAYLNLYVNNYEKDDNLSDVAKNLYNRYIKYSIETSDYENMNVNSSSSDEYLVKYAIYNIMKDNNINISDYEFNSDYGWDDGKPYLDGYKITTSQIRQYIKNNFKIERDIDFSNLDLDFICGSNISYFYYESEKLYRFIDDSSIPKSGGADAFVHSEMTKYESNGNDIIIYTDYLQATPGDPCWNLHSSSDDALIVDFLVYNEDYENICGADYDSINCILKNYSDKVGKFKHTFTKHADGNYYWASTQKMN